MGFLVQTKSWGSWFKQKQETDAQLSLSGCSGGGGPGTLPPCAGCSPRHFPRLPGHPRKTCSAGAFKRLLLTSHVREGVSQRELGDKETGKRDAAGKRASGQRERRRARGVHWLQGAAREGCRPRRWSLERRESPSLTPSNFSPCAYTLSRCMMVNTDCPLSPFL